MVKRSTAQAAGVVSLVFVLGTVTGASLILAYVAHHRRPPPHRVEDRVERLAQDLKLTGEQEEKVLAIFRETRPEFERLRLEAMKREDHPLRRLVEERDEKIRALLTPVQREAFNALQQERREKWRRHPPPPPPPG